MRATNGRPRGGNGATAGRPRGDSGLRNHRPASEGGLVRSLPVSLAVQAVHGAFRAFVQRADRPSTQGYSMRVTQPDRRLNARTSRIARAATGKRGDGKRGDVERREGDRRSRERLRELCDEVIASYRAATADDTLSAAERADAERLLARVAPLPRS